MSGNGLPPAIIPVLVNFFIPERFLFGAKGFHCSNLLQGQSVAHSMIITVGAKSGLLLM